ncbi:ribosomal protein s6 modification protein [Leptolyngbya sp. Heron Island J]|uniref:30S ribosomal protein S6--L-glutamate ligase n=1 Tax=Leptolyngbya sp. Heron Island J TaxID=1385935 RepID=UPI0003B9E930|nr:30S ribosomal protein S6--L-glutamate ligase [Leptolyngbya sp. Heron Island J]ESA38628.1 ribosomal protein s6 modification protein [Leptolyngbya sp. Heron Island J]
MKIAVLSRDASLYSTRRLLEAGNKRGHIMKIIDHMRCYIEITADRPRLIYQGKPLDDIDAVIPRIGASYTFYGTAVVRQFEMMGVLSANGSDAIARSRDKLRCLQLLSKEGVGLPVTGFAHSTKDTEGVIELVGGAPLVIKLLEGTQGIGVVLAETYQAAKSVIEAFRGLDANILVQEYIKEAKGQDLRCFVVNDQVIASMKRQGAPGEFRSNIHRGGTVRRVKLSAQERDTAIRAAMAMGLKVAGVDLLRSSHGPVVIEVNSSPGLEGIERATDIDIASKIIQYLEQQWRLQRKVAAKGKQTKE